MAADAVAGLLAVDMHGHCVPRSFLDEVVRTQACGVTAECVDGAYVVTYPGRTSLRPIAGVMTDAADRNDWFDDQQIGHQIVAPWLDVQGQELPASEGAPWVRLLNDSLAESVAEGSRHLSAHATLHLADPEVAADELRRAVEQLGMHSAMIPVSLPAGRLSDPGYDALWATASELEVPIVLHATTESPANDLLAQYPVLKGLFGRHVDLTLVTAELIVTGVLDRFPELRLVVVHGGGFLPYQTGRFDSDARRGDWVPTVPSEIVRALYYDTVLMPPAALRFLYDFVGADRVMLGSDYGALPTERGTPVTDAVCRTGAPQDVTDAVLAGNAIPLFGVATTLEPPPRRAARHG